MNFERFLNMQEPQMQVYNFELLYILLMTLIGSIIMIAWGNFIRNYLLRWIIATFVFYMPLNKEIDFKEITILEFLSDGLNIRVCGVVNESALLIPVYIKVFIKEIFIFDPDAKEPFFSVILSEPILIGKGDIHLDQEMQVKILKKERFQEFVCRGILGMKQSDVKLKGIGDFDFWLVKVSNLALEKNIYFKDGETSDSSESKIIPNMIFKPMPVLPSLYIFLDFLMF